MSALVVCLQAFATTFWAAKRSLGLGIVVVLAWGYFYGIIRANLPTVFSHFIFDTTLLAFYAANWRTLLFANDRRSTALRIWCAVLILWPILLLMAPFQPWLISLVGLRGYVLFVPMALLGSGMRSSDLLTLSKGLGVLNLAALGFGVAEYFLGLTRFYPVNAVTILIYASSDVAGGFYRIPAIFGTAHLYGGAMVTSIPYLLGGWANSKARVGRFLAIGGIIAALVGVLMSATRLNFMLGATMLLSTMSFSRFGMKRRIGFVVLILAVGVLAFRNERFQRFKSLSDSDYLEGRISGSVNRSFFEILSEHPLGNGLGGGGTSIPYFLEGQVRNPIGMENEYARILSEQGIVGLLLWLAFLFWFLCRFREAMAKNAWASARKIVWCLSLFEFGTAWIGLGLLTAIPGTAILLLGVGWVSVPAADEAVEERNPARRAVFPVPHYRPASTVNR